MISRILFKLPCKWVKSSFYSLAVAALPVREFDFGGDCDSFFAYHGVGLEVSMDMHDGETKKRH